MPKTRPIELSPLQEFPFRMFETGTSVPSWEVYDSDIPIDLDCLRRTLELLTSRHESLRAGFRCSDGQWRQEIHEHVEPAIHRRAVSTDAELERTLLELGLAPDDLGGCPVQCAVIQHEGTGHHVLALIVHHLASDLYSQWLLGKEIMTIYEALRRGETPALRTVPTPFSEWVAASSASSAPRVARFSAAIDAIAARGVKTVAPMMKMFMRPLPPGTRTGSFAARYMAHATAAIARVSDVGAVVQFDAGRLSRTHDVSLTVGALAGFRFVPVAAGVADLSPPEPDDMFAFGRAWLRSSDAAITAFDSRLAMVNVWTTMAYRRPGAQRAGSDKVLRPWTWERQMNLYMSANMINAGSRKARVGLPSTSIFLVFGEFDRAMIFTTDDAFADAEADAFIARIAACE